MAILRVVVGLTWNGDGSPGVNVWHVRQDNADFIPDLDDQLERLVEFYTAISTIYPTAVRITVPQDVVRVDTDPPEAVPFTSTVVNGSGGSTELSELLQLCVTWKTSVRSRSGTGRTFLGPLESNVNDPDGTPKNSVVTMVKAAAQTLIDNSNLLDGTGALGVYSRTQSIIRDFTAMDVRQDKFAVLKSRRD